VPSLARVVFPRAFSGRKETKEEKVSGRLKKEWKIFSRDESFSFLSWRNQALNVFRVTNETLKTTKIFFFPPKPKNKLFVLTGTLSTSSSSFYY